MGKERLCKVKAIMSNWWNTNIFYLLRLFTTSLV